MAGAVFGVVGVSLFVAGAALGEILRDSRSAKCCIFLYKMRLRGGGCEMTIYPRIIRGWSSNRLYIGGSNS